VLISCNLELGWQVCVLRGRSVAMSLAKLARTALLVSAASSLEIGRGPTASDADAPSPPEQCECDGGAPKWISEDVVEDVRARRGFFDARLEIRDGQYGRGIFTTADIAAQELLIALPFDLILSDDDDDGSPCGTINLLRRELELGRCSDHWPWLKSVHETLLPSPGSWSAEELAELDGLPPGNWRDQQELYQHHCATSRDDVFDPLLVLLSSPRTYTPPRALTVVMSCLRLERGCSR
jgi:hypothetical protein